MPEDLETQILKSLRSLTRADRPATFNDLARQFGVQVSLITSIGRQMVDRGLAEPSYANIRGVHTMYGLLPQPQPQPLDSTQH